MKLAVNSKFNDYFKLIRRNDNFLIFFSNAQHQIVYFTNEQEFENKK